MQASPVNPMDQGIRSFAEANALGAAEAAQWVKVAEVPFDFQRRRLSVVLRAADDTSKDPVLICKVLDLPGFWFGLALRVERSQLLCMAEVPCLCDVMLGAA